MRHCHDPTIHGQPVNHMAPTTTLIGRPVGAGATSAAHFGAAGLATF